jgi:anti-sigma B factor antagonist
LYAVAMPIESKQVQGGIAVVTISGRLTFGREAERLESIVGELLKGGQTKFVFDASTLEYVDSSGIGTIVSCLTQIKKAGADLRLAGASPRIKRLFTMTGVDKLLSLYPSVAEATAG